MFNAGMPHNTFLFVMARMGLIGIGLIGFAWWAGLAMLTRSIVRFRDADELAVANILVAMLLFASFVLFFERPLNGPALWIMLAVGARLAASRPIRQLPVHKLVSPPVAEAHRARPRVILATEPTSDRI